MTLTQGTYEAKISVPASFGPVGAVLVENEHHREMFLKDIKLITGGDESTATTFHIDSWVHSKFDNPEPRVFFSVRVINEASHIHPAMKLSVDADGHGTVRRN
jgi:lipoxygenase